MTHVPARQRKRSSSVSGRPSTYFAQIHKSYSSWNSSTTSSWLFRSNKRPEPHHVRVLNKKALFKDALLNSTAKFKFVISSVSIQQTFAFPYDSWEGYGAERSEILNFIRNNAIKNVVFLTTDLHLNLMNKVSIDLFTDPSPISYEVVTGPIGAETDKARILRLLGPAGPLFV